MKSKRESWEANRNRVIRSEVHSCLKTLTVSHNCDLLGRQLDIVLPGFAYHSIAELFIGEAVAIANAWTELGCHVVHILAQLNIRQLPLANLPSPAAEDEKHRDGYNDLYLSDTHRDRGSILIAGSGHRRQFTSAQPDHNGAQILVQVTFVAFRSWTLVFPL